MEGQTLPRAERICRRQDFERVYNTGTRIHGRFMTLFVLPGGLVARIGVAATKKLGTAVTRNRAKRLARELFRRHKAAAGRADVVVIPRREMLDAPFVTLETDFRKTLERAGRQGSTPPTDRRAGGGRRPRAAPRV